METNTEKVWVLIRRIVCAAENNNKNTGLVTRMGKIDGRACPGLNLKGESPEDGVCQLFLPGEVEN